MLDYIFQYMLAIYVSYLLVTLAIYWYEDRKLIYKQWLLYNLIFWISNGIYTYLYYVYFDLY